MKALSLIQPWASLILLGVKHFETRSWGTDYRGPLAVHASKRMDVDAIDFCESNTEELRQAGIEDFTELPLGAVLGVVRLVEIIPTDGPQAARLTRAEKAWGNWAPGRRAWRVVDPRPFARPIPARGVRARADQACTQGGSSMFASVAS